MAFLVPDIFQEQPIIIFDSDPPLHASQQGLLQTSETWVYMSDLASRFKDHLMVAWTAQPEKRLESGNLRLEWWTTPTPTPKGAARSHDDTGPAPDVVMGTQGLLAGLDGVGETDYTAGSSHEHTTTAHSPSTATPSSSSTVPAAPQRGFKDFPLAQKDTVLRGWEGLQTNPDVARVVIKCYAGQNPFSLGAGGAFVAGVLDGPGEKKKGVTGAGTGPGGVGGALGSAWDQTREKKREELVQAGFEG